jgi:hypothetical protein
LVCILRSLIGAAPATAAPCGGGNPNHWCIAQGDVNPTSEGPELSDHFGSALDFGDFDGDGRQDLAIGAPGEDFVGLNAGQVDVYSSNGLQFDLFQRTFRQNGTVGDDGGSETDDQMGATLVSGDFDGDGFDDLAIASPTEDLVVPVGTDCGEFGRCDDFGIVQIIWGGDNGLFQTDVTVHDFRTVGLTGSEPTLFPLDLGACLAAGDVDFDGIDDLVIGAPGYALGSTSAGVLTLLRGSADRELDDQLTFHRVAEDAFDHLGGACAIGHFATDSVNFLKRQVVGGCPDCDPAGSGEAGALVEFYSGGADEHPQTDFGTAGNGANDHLGQVLAVGDFDHDGFDDVAAGVPSKNDGGVTDSGRVYVAYGGGGGLLLGGFRILGLDSFPGVALESGARFGAALAAGDLDGDGVDDLAIGAPNLGNDDRGFVFVAFGKKSSTALDIRSAFVISSPSIGGTAQSNAHFGAALAIGDIDGAKGGDHAAELAIGAPDENAGATDSGKVYVTRIFDPHWVFGDTFESQGLTIWSSHVP